MADEIFIVEIAVRGVRDVESLDRAVKNVNSTAANFVDTTRKTGKAGTDAAKQQVAALNKVKDAIKAVSDAQVRAAELELKTTQTVERARTKRTSIEETNKTARIESTNLARTRVAELALGGEQVRAATEKFLKSMDASIEAERTAARRYEADERRARSLTERENQQDRLRIVQEQTVQRRLRTQDNRDTGAERASLQAAKERAQIARDASKAQIEVLRAAVAQGRDAARAQREQDNNVAKASLFASKALARRQEDQRRQQQQDARLRATADRDQARADRERVNNAARLAREQLSASSRLEAVRTQQETTAARNRNRILVSLQQGLLNELQQVTRFGFSVVTKIFDTAGRVITSTWSGVMRRLAPNTRSAMAEQEGIIASSGERMRSLLSRISPAAILGTLGGGALGKSAFDAFKDYELLVLSLQRRIGDPAKVDKLLGEVQTLAKATPFEIGDVESLAKSFLSIEPNLDKLVPTLTTVADAVSFTGGSGVNLDRIRLALGQIKSAGKLQGDELNQLAESLPGIDLRQIVANQLGITTAELISRQKAGNLKADEFIPAFLEGLKEVPGLAGNASASVDTLSGRLSNLKDTFTINARETVGVLAPAIKAGLTGLAEFTDRSFKFIRDVVTNAGNLFKLYRFRVAQQFAILGKDPAIRNAIDSVRFGIAAIQDAFNRESSAGQRSLVVKVWEEIPNIFERIRRVAVRVAPTVERIGDSLTGLAGDINERGLDAVKDKLASIAKVVAPGAGLVTGLMLTRGALQSLSKGNVVQGGLLLAAGGLLTLYRTNEDFRLSIDRTITRLKELGNEVVTAFQGGKVTGGFWDQLAGGAGRFASSSLAAIREVGAGLSGLFSGQTDVSAFVQSIRERLQGGVDQLLEPVKKRFTTLFSDIDPLEIADGIRRLFVPLGRVLGEFLGSKEFLGVVGAIVGAAASAAVGFVQGFVQGLANSDLGQMIGDLLVKVIESIPAMLSGAFEAVFTNGPLAGIAVTIAGGLGLAKLVSVTAAAARAVQGHWRNLMATGTRVASAISSVGDKFTALSGKVLNFAGRLSSGVAQNGLLSVAVGLDRIGTSAQKAATYVWRDFGSIVATFTTVSIAFSTLFSDATPAEKILSLIPLVLSIIPVIQQVQTAASTMGISLGAAFAPLAVVSGIAILLSWLTRARDETDKTAESQKRLADVRRATQAAFTQSLDTANGDLGLARIDFAAQFVKKVREGDKALSDLTKQTARFGFDANETARAIVSQGDAYADLVGPVKRYRDGLREARDALAEFSTADPYEFVRRSDAKDVLGRAVDGLEAIQSKVPEAKAALKNLRSALDNVADGKLNLAANDLAAGFDKLTPKIREQLGITEETVAQIQAQRDAYKEALQQQQLAVEVAQEKAKYEEQSKTSAQKTLDLYNAQKQAIAGVKDLLSGATQGEEDNFNQSQRDLVTSTEQQVSNLKELLGQAGGLGALVSDQFSVAGSKFFDIIKGLKDGAADALSAASVTFSKDPAKFVKAADDVRKNFVRALTANGGISAEQANAIADSIFTPLLDQLASGDSSVSATAIAARTKFIEFFTANPITGVSIDLTTPAIKEIDDVDTAINAWLAAPTDPKTLQTFLSIDGAKEILDRYTENPQSVNLQAELQNLAETESQLNTATAPRTIPVTVDVGIQGLKSVDDLKTFFSGKPTTNASGAQTITAPLRKELDAVPVAAKDAATKATNELGKLPGAIFRATDSGMRRWSDSTKTTISGVVDAAKTAPDRVVSGVQSLDSKLAAPTDRIRGRFDAITDSINRVVTATGGTPAAPSNVRKGSTIPVFHSGGVVGEGGSTTPVRPLSPGEELILAQSREGIIPRDAMAKMSRAEFEWIRRGKLADLIAAKAAVPLSLNLIAGVRAGEQESALLPAVVSGLARMVDRATGFLEEASKLLSMKIGASIGDRPKGISGANPFATFWISQAMAIAGAPASWFTGLYTIARRESGLNPRAISLWDSNAAKGIPSKGLMQTIEPTFRRYMLPGYEDIWNPVHNVIAAIRYIRARYGDISKVQQADPTKPPKGYAYGDIVNKPTLGVFGEAGPEVILPLSKPKRFMELLGGAMRYMGLPMFARGGIFTRPRGREEYPHLYKPAEIAAMSDTALGRLVQGKFRQMVRLYQEATGLGPRHQQSALDLLNVAQNWFYTIRLPAYYRNANWLGPLPNPFFPALGQLVNFFDRIVPFLNNLDRLFKASQPPRKRGFAQGDIVSTPTLGVFGEAGPEVILPLSKPKRFMQLLGSALRYMGIPAFSQGAIFTGPSLDTPDIGAKVIDIRTARSQREAPAYAGPQRVEPHVHVHTNVIDPRSAVEYGMARMEEELNRWLA